MPKCAAQVLTAVVLIVLTTSCSKDPERLLRQHLERGDAFVAKKEYPNAIIEYRNAVNAVPSSADARIKLGEAYLGARDGLNALREYVRAADLRHDDLKLQLTTARLLSLAGDLEAANARVDAVLGADPKNIDAYILKGQFLLGVKDVDAAVAQIQEAIKLDPNQSRTYTALGTTALMAGKKEEAETALRRAVELSPRSVPAHLALGYYHWENHQVDEAEKALLTAIQYEPGHVPARRMLVTLYLMMGRLPDAEAQMKGIVEVSSDPEPELNLADFYLEQNRLPEAAAILEPLRANTRVGAKVKERLALIQFGQGHFAEANRIVDDVLIDQPRNIDALITKTRFLIYEKRTDEALSRAKQAVEADPGSALALYLLGGLHAQKNNLEEALRTFNAALTLNPRAVPARLAAGQLYLALGDSQSGLDAATSALRIQPFNPTARLFHAQALLATGAVKDADALLTTLAKQYPESSSIQALLGRVAVGKGDRPGALNFFRRALELGPDNRSALDGLMNLQIQDKRPDEARRLAQARLGASPNDPQLLMLLAGAYIAENNLAEAERTLKRVLEIDPTNLTTYGMLGSLLIRSNRLDEARAEYERAGRREPPPIGALTMVGLILEAQGKKDDARRQYERVVGLDANAAVAANNLANIYLETGQNLDVALQLAQSAKARVPTNAAFNDTLGWIYHAKKLDSLAVGPLQESVAQDPGNPLYWFHLGMAWAGTGSGQKAREALERALALKADFSGAEEARKMLLAIKAN